MQLVKCDTDAVIFQCDGFEQEIFGGIEEVAAAYKDLFLLRFDEDIQVYLSKIELKKLALFLSTYEFINKRIV